jgi:hypothetical protein
MSYRSRRLGASLLGLVLAAGCGGGGAVDAASPDAHDPTADAAPECREAPDCDDGLACNGVETCAGGRCATGMPMRCDDGIDCTTDFCSEELRRCVNRPPDEDGDGVEDAECLDARGMPFGADCDDSRANVNPGAPELCDPENIDEDCNAASRGPDSDGDGFQDARCCNGDACGDDCNDGARAANPMATEVCNALDDDCDGRVDEGVLVMGFRDADGDGHGDPAVSMTACGTRAGFATLGDDCDDTSALRSPDLPEICDTVDNDCDGTPDPADSTVTATWYADDDGDGFGASVRSTVSCAVPSGRWSLYATDCDDTAANVSPATAERCNGRDDDCNGSADFVVAPGDLEDDDRDGVADSRCVPTPTPADCDDRDTSSGPGSAELCDGRDNDCDGSVDERVASFAYFRDADGDGYGGGSGGVLVGCVPPAGYTSRGGDCDDTDAMRSPSASEGCNGRDDDCDAAVDEAPATARSCMPSMGQERACIGGGCRVVGCLEGFFDCDFDPTNGCESSSRGCR